MNTGSRCPTSDGENTTSYCTTGSPWRSTSTLLPELKEFRLRIIGFLQQNLKEELSFHSINNLTLLKQKRESKRLHDEHLARTQQEYRDVPRRDQIRQRKGQQFEGHEKYDYVVDPNTGWRVYRQQSRGNLQTSVSGSRANPQAASSSSPTGDQTQWKTSNWNSQHSSSFDKW